VTSALFVVNPAAGGGAARRRWPGLETYARSLGIAPDVVFTDGPGHATAIVRDAVSDGRRLIAVVGGDGTVNEAVNGFFDADGTPVGRETELAIVAVGTGRDTIRTYGIPKRADEALRLVANGRSRLVDVGWAEFTTDGGAPGRRAFINAGSCGMTGQVAERATHTTRRLGGTAAFMWATVTTFVAWKNVPLEVEIDDERLDLVGNNAIVANGCYLGGGMRLCPDAKPDDGLLDVLVWGDVTKLDLARTLHKLYRGTHVDHPKATMRKAHRVSVRSTEPLPLELDGEQPGQAPVTFTVLPGSLRLRAP
jgi:YegS/Rv2252/BmrU family lipid kinase